jgi:hypothetical protein
VPPASVAPEAAPFFSRKIDFGDKVVTLELGIAAEPVGVYLEWAGKPVVVGLDRLGLHRRGRRRHPASVRPPRARCNVSLYNEQGNGAARQRNMLERAIDEAVARRVK